MWFAMYIIIGPGILVCSSFLRSVSLFILSKALLISSATVIVHAGGTIWLNPFTTVLFIVCSTVTVEQCFQTCAPWSPCSPQCNTKGSAGDDITNK